MITVTTTGERTSNACIFSGCGESGYSIRWPLCKRHFGGITPFVARDYQVDGIRWLMGNQHAMNTDAPGLGKTAQAALAAEAPVLVCAPNYLVKQWQQWLCGEDEKSMERNDGQIWPNIDPAQSVLVCGGDRWEKRRGIRQHEDWTIINHEALDTHYELLSRQYYKTIIIDESHHLKNHSGERARAAAKLCRLVDNVYLLTATPVKREIDDLYMQLHIMFPQMFKSYNAFVEYYCMTESDQFGVKVLGIKHRMAPELEELLDAIRLGRSYEMAGRELPPVIEKYVKIELPPATRKIYDEAVNYWRIEELEEHYVNYMQVYHQLRQLVTGAFKYDAVNELLSDEVRRAVVFSWYKETAYGIQQRFGDGMVAVTGDIKNVDERTERAKGDKHVSATISSLSEGIDLSDARSVIYAEEDWTPGSNYQALSRVRRERTGEGADNSQPVIVTYVHCIKTIDEVIHNKSKRRAGTIREVIREALFL